MKNVCYIKCYNGNTRIYGCKNILDRVNQMQKTKIDEPMKEIGLGTYIKNLEKQLSQKNKIMDTQADKIKELAHKLSQSIPKKKIINVLKDCPLDVNAYNAVRFIERELSFSAGE